MTTTTTRARAGLAAATSMVVMGAGLVLAPLMASALANPVGSPSAPVTIPNTSAPQSPENNQVETWCGLDEDDEPDGIKIDGANLPSVRYYQLTMAASLLVIKAGAGSEANDIWFDPALGYYGTSDGKDISHVIVCNPKTTTGSETSSAAATTSSAAATTSSAAATTTSAAATTTSAAATTTSAAATTTSAAAATTEAAETSEAAETEAVETEAAAPPATTTAPALAETGSTFDPTIAVALGLGLLGAGAVTMVATRRSGSHA